MERNRNSDLDTYNQSFQIRPYSDSDFEEIAKLMMNMYNDASEMLRSQSPISLEEARKAVISDLFVPDVRVLVLKCSIDNRLVGFISYARQNDKKFCVEHEWVEKDYAKYGYDNKMFEHVEDEAREAGATTLSVRVNPMEHRLINFLAGRGYQTLKMLELIQYLSEPAEDLSNKSIEIEGHKFKVGWRSC